MLLARTLAQTAVYVAYTVSFLDLGRTSMTASSMDAAVEGGDLGAELVAQGLTELTRVTQVVASSINAPPPPPAPPPALAIADFAGMAPTFICPYYDTTCKPEASPPCPCFSDACANSNHDSLSYAKLLPACMRVTLAFCNTAFTASIQPACTSFTTRKQEVKRIGRDGGVMDSDTPTRGGQMSRMTLPLDALTEDVDLGMGEIFYDEFTARLPNGRRAMSAYISLTPHGHIFSESVDIEIPFTRSVGGYGLKVMKTPNETSNVWIELPYIVNIVDETTAIASIRMPTFSVVVVAEDSASPSPPPPSPPIRLSSSQDLVVSKLRFLDLQYFSNLLQHSARFFAPRFWGHDLSLS